MMKPVLGKGTLEGSSDEGEEREDISEWSLSEESMAVNS